MHRNSQRLRRSPAYLDDEIEQCVSSSARKRRHPGREPHPGSPDGEINASVEHLNADGGGALAPERQTRVHPRRPAGRSAGKHAGRPLVTLDGRQSTGTHTRWILAAILRACSSVLMSPGSLVRTRSAGAAMSATCASIPSAEPAIASSSPIRLPSLLPSASIPTPASTLARLACLC